MFQSIFKTIFRGLVDNTYAVTKLRSVDVRSLLHKSITSVHQPISA